MICRRCGSASALNTASAEGASGAAALAAFCAGSGTWLNLSSSAGAGLLKVGGPLVALGAERGAAVAVNVVDKARQILAPPRGAHVVALELLGESLVAELQRGATPRGGAHVEVDVGADPLRQRLGHGHRPPDVLRRLGLLHLDDDGRVTEH